MRRNGRFHNPQPALFIGLRDCPNQALLFDGTDPDPEPTPRWQDIFARPRHTALCKELADGLLILDTGSHADMLRACQVAAERDGRNNYDIQGTCETVGTIIDRNGEAI
jgi:hypothetical protein